MAAALAKLATNPKIADVAKNVVKDSSIVEKLAMPSAPSPTDTTTTSATMTRKFTIGICRVIKMIWEFIVKLWNNFIKPFFKFLFLTRSPAAYVVWLIIIILIILGAIGGVMFFKKKRSNLATNPNLEDTRKNKSSALSGNPTNDGWKTRALQDSTKSGTAVDGYARNTLTGGRCDGLNWSSDPDSKNECIKTIPPSTIRWKLNSGDYPDIKNLPEPWLNQNMDKQTINVPYKLLSDGFYADCTNMTYNDGSRATLFTQNGVNSSTCYFIEKSATSFEDEKRKKDYKDLYTICKNK